MKKLYKILEVSENATEKEIKKAYRKLAKKYHPDKCKTPECEEKFKEINAANEILSNPESKAQYDKYGDRLFEEQTGQGFHEYTNSFTDLDDILNQMFGGFHHQRGPILDKTLRVRVPLEKAIKGGKMTIRGHKIKIPKYVYQGIKLRVQGAGETYNGKTGDLYIQLVISGDDNFEVNGDSIHTTLVLDIKEAIFGSHKEIDLYGDKIKIKTPKDIKYGQILRVQGKGLKGDNLYIHLLYKLPKSHMIKENDLSFI